MVKNNTLSYRMAQLEKVVEKLDGRVDNLLENDLPHIQLALGQLKTHVNILTLVNISGLILAIILNRYM